MSGLTAEQKQARDGRLTASQVGILMRGNEEDIYNLWRLHIGDPSYQEEDLSDIWAVQRGIATEALNLRWFEKRTGHKLSRHGEVCLHPTYEWAACTLDAWNSDLDCPVEAKDCGGFQKMDDIIARYQPQLHWQMIVTRSGRSQLSVILNGNEPVVTEIKRDADYEIVLWQRALDYWRCVETMTPPVALPQVAPPIPHEALIEKDMSVSNSWAMQASEWLAHRGAAKKFETASKELKSLMLPEYGRAFGHGVEITRNKAKALTIKEMAV